MASHRGGKDSLCCELENVSYNRERFSSLEHPEEKMHEGIKQTGTTWVLGTFSFQWAYADR